MCVGVGVGRFDNTRPVSTRHRNIVKQRHTRLSPPRRTYSRTLSITHWLRPRLPARSNRASPSSGSSSKARIRASVSAAVLGVCPSRRRASFIIPAMYASRLELGAPHGRPSLGLHLTRATLPAKWRRHRSREHAPAIAAHGGQAALTAARSATETKVNTLESASSSPPWGSEGARALAAPADASSSSLERVREAIGVVDSNASACWKVL